MFDTDFGPAIVSHTCANDGVVEGVRLTNGRAFSVQYHPEAGPGPHDSLYLFDRFLEQIEQGRRPVQERPDADQSSQNAGLDAPRRYNA